MKVKYLKMGLCGLMIFSFTLLNGQDPQFSQFYNSSLYYNPATAGLTRDLRISTSYRKLWSKIPGDLSTYFFSVDYRWSKPKVGVGLLVLNDNEGLHKLRTQRMELIFSYRPIDARDKMLQFGMSVFSINKKDFRNNDFIFTDQLDPIYGVVQQSSFMYAAVEPVIYADWNAGMVYRQNIFIKRPMTPTIGFSASHLTRPEISFVNSDKVRLPLKFVVHASLLTQVKFENSAHRKDVVATLDPGFVYEYQEPFHTFTIGSGFNLDPLRFGMWFRNQGFPSGVYKFNSVIINAGIKIPTSKNHSLIIDYSYDSTISKLEFASGGAHEITLIFNLPLPERGTCYNEWWKEGLNYKPPELKSKK
jgi:type IX secretion system PorP/SprF family membrane protein